MEQPHFDTRTACPGCGGARFMAIYEAAFDQPPIRGYLEWFYRPVGGVELEYLKGAVYCLCECGGCGMIFQKQIPNEQLMKRLYERWIDPEKVRAANEGHEGLAYHVSHAEEVMRVIAWLGRPPSSLSFLDFGMGWGHWALMAKAFGCDAYGSELSTERIQHARSQGIKVVSWEEIPHCRFDFINTEQVFEHIPKPLETLCHLKQSLKPGGVIKVSVPNTRHIGRKLRVMDWEARRGSRNSLTAVAPLQHINCYRRSSLVAMGGAAGMEEVFLPMRRQYQYAAQWSSVKQIIKNFILPLKRNVLRSHNYVFFRRSDGGH